MRTWKKNGQDIWACDLVPVVTLLLGTIHALVIVHHQSQRLMHFGATAHPWDQWITQVNAHPVAPKQNPCGGRGLFLDHFLAGQLMVGCPNVHSHKAQWDVLGPYPDVIPNLSMQDFALLNQFWADFQTSSLRAPLAVDKYNLVV